MNKTLMTLSSLALLAFSSTGFAALSDFKGNWINADNNTRGMTQLKIRTQGKKVWVRAFGQCHPTDCDWGEVKGAAYANNAGQNLKRKANLVSAEFKPGHSRTFVTITKLNNNRLKVNSFTHFTDGSGRANYHKSMVFRRAVIANPFPFPNPVKEDCIRFNPDHAHLERGAGKWRIVANGMLLKSFDKKREARKALRVIKRYRTNKQCFVGRPGPSLEYYLKGNQSPVGPMAGEDCLSFNPGNAKVKKINNRWKIVDGNHWLMDFGNKKGEAHKAMRIIRKHGFSKSCFVGRPGPSMSYLRK